MPNIKKRDTTAWIRRVAATYGKKVGEVGYMFVDDEHILQTNRDFLGHDYYTDIITFDYCEGDTLHGDIVISLDTVRTNAEKFGKTYDEELHRVIIHGILHLCGINDKGPGEREIMEQAENRASIHFDDGAIDKAIVQTEGKGIDRFIDSGKTVDRRLLTDILPDCFRLFLLPVGLHKAWRHSIHRHLFFLKHLHKILHQSMDRCLGDTVGQHRGMGMNAHGRPSEEDATSTGDEREEFAQKDDMSVQCHLHLCIPVFISGVNK